ncbi:hypothetical protein M9H77_16654 [Catharanthus roseus]|uniref:Uncharacterized protein n=1 Tax=Catharanthus roseus TaxID=4058 RepID=A0ACC0B2E5_CATRO|nr:hypothetical protein M9H77_16654 [Catharanthus roseus]
MELDAFKKKREGAHRNYLQGHDGQRPGKHTDESSGRKWARVVRPTTLAKGTEKYQELKRNAERLHIETHSPIPRQAVNPSPPSAGRQQQYVIGFVTSSAAAHDAFIDREKRLWGYMM